MSETPKPNFVVIMSDQHNPHVMGCSGDAVVRTPNLDRLARRGVRFASNYCTFPVCVPARLSFLSSRPCSDIGAWDNSDALGSQVPTFAHALTLAGYDTVLCGRMHLHDPHSQVGFTDRIAGDLLSAYGPTDPKELLGGLPFGTAAHVPTALKFSGPGRTTYQAFDDYVTDVALNYIRDRAREEGKSDRPVCLVVGFVLPHCPFICPRDLFDEYYQQVQMPPLPEGYRDSLHPAVLEYRRRMGMDLPSAEEARTARAAYYGMVTYLDRNIGRLLDALEAASHWRNAIIIYTSDHGDMAGEHAMWMKTCFYEGSVAVPLLFAGPGIAATRNVTAVTSLMDIGPTLIDLAGGEALPDVAGRSLAGFLNGKAAVRDWPDEVIAENAAGNFSRMIRRGDWKLSYFENHDQPQLFNLAEDPQEFHDRANDPDCADIVRLLKSRVLENWSPDQWRAQRARRSGMAAVVRKWAAAIQPRDPYLWVAPEGTLVFPEPHQPG
jgi:choline-sulfatase